MGLIEEFDHLAPSKGDWRVADVDENHIWDGSDHHPLCGYVRTRSDSDFVVFAYKNLHIFVAEIKANRAELEVLRGNVSALETTVSGLRENVEKLGADKLSLISLLQKASDPNLTTDLFTQELLQKEIKGVLDGQNDKNAERNL